VARQGGHRDQRGRPFWEAEAEHRDYLQRYANGYNCRFPRPGWKLPHRETAA
jgi:peptide-methionine (S)-S-oxide reductase